MVHGSCFNFKLKNGPNGGKEIFLCEILNINQELIPKTNVNNKNINEMRYLKIKMIKT